MTSKSTSSQEPNVPFSHDDFAKALEQHDYQFEKGQIVRGKVYEYTSEGALISIGGKSDGFVPSKEASLQTGVSLAASLPLQEDLDFLIISGQNAEGQVTLSRRQLELQRAWNNIAEIFESGKSVQMRVTGLNKGGVTGDVEGLRGFIPRSHLIEKDDLESLMGQLLTATFLEVSEENNKLILSQRQAINAAAIGKLAQGALMEGRVAKIQPYGVFVELDGITGLLHITQVSGSRVDALTNVFKIGQQIKVIILDIDEHKNRISLSTKVLESYPGEMLEKLDEVMANAEERLEQARQKINEPKGNEPKVVQPKIAKTDVVKTDVVKTDVVETDLVEPSVAETEVAKTYLVEPSVAETEVTETDLVEPSVAETEVTETDLVETDA